jgi:putative transposase
LEVFKDWIEPPWKGRGNGNGRRHYGDIIGDRFIYCLADREKKRAESYAAWIKETIAAGEWELIRKSLQRGQLTGSPRFLDEIEE